MQEIHASPVSVRMGLILASSVLLHGLLLAALPSMPSIGIPSNNPQTLRVSLKAPPAEPAKVPEPPEEAVAEPELPKAPAAKPPEPLPDTAQAPMPPPLTSKAPHPKKAPVPPKPKPETTALKKMPPLESKPKPPVREETELAKALPEPQPLVEAKPLDQPVRDAAASAPTAVADESQAASVNTKPSPQLLRALRAAVENHKRYPMIARRSRRQGESVIGLRLHPDGSLDQVSVVQGSGYRPLDKAALKAVRAIEPFRVAQEHLQAPMNLKLTVVFRLR